MLYGVLILSSYHVFVPVDTVVIFAGLLVPFCPPIDDVWTVMKRRVVKLVAFIRDFGLVVS